MNVIVRLGVVITLAVLAGCGPSLTRVTPTSPVSGLTVEVGEFGYQPWRGAESAGPLAEGGLAQRIAAALRDAGVKVVEQDSDLAADVLLEGQISQITRGNRGSRWAGAYAGSRGAAQFAVEGQALRADGTVIGKFSASRSADFGLFGGNSDTLLENCVEAVVYDISNMLVTGRYGHSHEGVTRGNALVTP